MTVSCMSPYIRLEIYDIEADNSACQVLVKDSYAARPSFRTAWLSEGRVLHVAMDVYHTPHKQTITVLTLSDLPWRDRPQTASDCKISARSLALDCDLVAWCVSPAADAVAFVARSDPCAISTATLELGRGNIDELFADIKNAASGRTWP
jgi:hypothetical protein